MTRQNKTKIENHKTRQKTRQDKTKDNYKTTTRQYKTTTRQRQDKTKQDKTRQDKTRQGEQGKVRQDVTTTYYATATSHNFRWVRKIDLKKYTGTKDREKYTGKMERKKEIYLAQQASAHVCGDAIQDKIYKTRTKQAEDKTKAKSQDKIRRRKVQDRTI
jgi:hypothetical protein